MRPRIYEAHFKYCSRSIWNERATHWIVPFTIERVMLFFDKSYQSGNLAEIPLSANRSRHLCVQTISSGPGGPGRYRKKLPARMLRPIYGRGSAGAVWIPAQISATFSQKEVRPVRRHACFRRRLEFRLVAFFVRASRRRTPAPSYRSRLLQGKSVTPVFIDSSYFKDWESLTGGFLILSKFPCFVIRSCFPITNYTYRFENLRGRKFASSKSMSELFKNSLSIIIHIYLHITNMQSLTLLQLTF